MLRIRLQRVGKKHDPSFRVVLTDSARAARSGSVNEVLGFYSAKREQTKLSGDKIKEWMAKGAQVSDTVHNILVKNSRRSEGQRSRHENQTGGKIGREKRRSGKIKQGILTDFIF